MTSARRALWWGVLCAAAAGCVDAQSPLVDGPTGEDAALLRMLDAGRRGDCEAIATEAATFSTASAVRLMRIDAVLGQCRYDAGQLAEATALLDRVAPHRSRSFTRDATYFGGRAHARLGAHARAVERFDALLGCCAGSRLDDAGYHRGRALHRLDRFAEARAGLAEVVDHPATSPYYRARALYRIGKAWYGEAMAGAERAAPLAEARAWYQRVLAEHPDEPVAADAAYGIGKAHYRAGDFEAARQTFAAVVADYPGRSAAARADYYLGRTLAALDQPVAAAEHLAGFPTRWPGSAYEDNARYYQGRAHYTAGGAGDAAQFEAAYTVFSELRRAFPESRYDLSATYFGARALYQLDRDGEALPDLLTVADSASVYADNARYYAGMASYNLGVRRREPTLWRQAVSHFDRLLADHPDSSYVAAGTYFAGRALTRLGRLAEADARFGLVIGAHPDSSYLDNAYRRRVEVRASQGDCAGARSALDAMRGATPDSSELPAAEAALGAAC